MVSKIQADEISSIIKERINNFELSVDINETGKVISFGYHTTFLGKKRGFELEEVCIFGHSGAQHATIAIVENKKT